MKKIMIILIVALATTSAFASGNKEQQKAPVGPTINVIDSKGRSVEVPQEISRLVVLDYAALDMIDALGLGHLVVGMPKSTTVSYLRDYANNLSIIDVGTVKEVNLEKIHALQPDLIIIGGRLFETIDQLQKIAPTICLSIDYTVPYLDALTYNTNLIANIFNTHETADSIISSFKARLKTLKSISEGKNAIIALASKSALSAVGPQARCSLISNEIGFTNLVATDATHGETVSFEYLITQDPDYIFVVDRDSAIGSTGSKTAKEVIENELVKTTRVFQEGNIVYLTSEVWYLAEGGLTATDVMISDIEQALL